MNSWAQIRDEMGIEDTVAVMDTELTDHMMRLNFRYR